VTVIGDLKHPFTYITSPGLDPGLAQAWLFRFGAFIRVPDLHLSIWLVLGHTPGCGINESRGLFYLWSFVFLCSLAFSEVLALIGD
jgi:hypothetical protein